MFSDADKKTIQIMHQKNYYLIGRTAVGHVAETLERLGHKQDTSVIVKKPSGASNRLLLFRSASFDTFADAEKTGFRRVQRGVDRDISGHPQFGYDYMNARGERSMLVWFAKETNKVGAPGCFMPMYPPDYKEIEA